MRKLMREPLMHFAVIGLALYGLQASVVDRPNSENIVVTRAEIDRLAATYQQQFRVRPTATQLEQLVKNHIREEIYWREGIALGLDRNDEIVRRRIAQKYAFLQQDLAVVEPPTPAQLDDYFQRHSQRYLISPRVSFIQVYINPDHGADLSSRISTIGARLQHTAFNQAGKVGDNFPGQRDLVNLNRRELARIFGDSEIVDAAFAAPKHSWAGPFRSGYGSHFIYVTAKTASHQPILADVKTRVTRDYLAEKQQEAETAAYSRLMEKYNVSVEETP